MSNSIGRNRKKQYQPVEKLAKTTKPQTFKKDTCGVYNITIKKIVKQLIEQED